MEKDQFISMIHFLVKLEEERTQGNHKMKGMVKELTDTHKQDMRAPSSFTESANLRLIADQIKENKAFLSLYTLNKLKDIFRLCLFNCRLSIIRI